MEMTVIFRMGISILRSFRVPLTQTTNEAGWIGHSRPHPRPHPRPFLHRPRFPKIVSSRWRCTVAARPWSLDVRFADEPEGLSRHVVAAGSQADGHTVSEISTGGMRRMRLGAALANLFQTLHS